MVVVDISHMHICHSREIRHLSIPVMEKAAENGQVNSTADELLAVGKRCLACGEPSNASVALQKACELLSQQHGDVSEALAEPYYLYGKALLGVARNEISVLGNGVPVPQEAVDSSEEDEEEEEQEDEKEEEKEEEEGGPQEEEEQPTSSEPAASEGPSADPPSEPGAAEPTTTQPEAEKEEEEQEELSNLQLAWEVLEVSRILYQRQETNEGRLKLAEVNMVLGEVSLESDHYDRGLEDFTTCLQLREAVLEQTDRRLAEAHFQLGLAYTLAKRLDEAVDEYARARQVLMLRKEVLQNDAEKKEEAERKMLEEEIAEIDSLIPDIDSKITDVEELKNASQELKNEEGEEEEESSTTIGFGSSATDEGMSGANEAPVTDISHLVRKRRADEQVSGDKDAKRRCATEESGIPSQTAE